MPIAFEPPPTQATTASGSFGLSAARTSRPMIDWKSRTMTGYGWGPTTDPMM
jgi:hypothetical protein